MKKFLLRKEVYACQTNDGAIFMDLRSGAYVGLDLETTSQLAPLIEGWPIRTGTDPLDSSTTNLELPETRAAALTNKPTLLTTTEDWGKPAEFPILQQTDAVPFRGTVVPWPRISVRLLARFCWAYAYALVCIKVLSLAGPVRRAGLRKARPRRRGEIAHAEIIELVRVFRFLTPFFYAAQNSCLLDSLTLLEFLAQYNVHPTWIIGVRTRPFEAHSWLQLHALVLNDRLEKVQQYVPILAV